MLTLPNDSRTPTGGEVTRSGAAGHGLQEVVGHQLRLHEWKQVPTGKHVGLDAEPVTSDPALQADREEAVVPSGENADPELPATP